MPYRTFLPYSIAGGVLWICSMVLSGYFFGTMIEDFLHIKLADHIEKVVIVVVFLSLLPPIIEYLKHKYGKKEESTELGA
jgi:membrane-associated protein